MPKRNSLDLNVTDSALRTFAQLNLRSEAYRAIAMELRKAGVKTGEEEDQIEDVFQSALLASLTALRKGAHIEDLRSYFISVCRRAAKRWLRDSMRRERSNRQAQELLTALRGEVSLPNEPLEDERSMVLAALSRLPERHQRMINLMIVNNLTPAEISTTLGLTLGGARTAMARAIKALRDVLKSDLSDLVRSRMAKPATKKENELWQEFKAELENES